MGTQVFETYPSGTTGTGGITSLGSSATWVGAYVWFYVDNSTVRYPDYRISGKIRVSSSSVTANTEIRIYLVGSNDNSTWPDTVTSTPGAITFTSEGVRDGCAKLAASLRVDSTTTSRDYPYDFNAREIFGGSVPKGFVCVVTQNTGTLNGTGSTHTYGYFGQHPTIGA